MNDVLDTLKKLPKVCATRLLSDNRPIIIMRGQSGYYPAPQLKTDDHIKAFNEEAGATPVHVEAMMTGSMFGWEVRGADPDTYTTNEQGEVVLREKVGGAAE